MSACTEASNCRRTERSVFAASPRYVSPVSDISRSIVTPNASSLNRRLRAIQIALLELEPFGRRQLQAILSRARLSQLGDASRSLGVHHNRVIAQGLPICRRIAGSVDWHGIHVEVGERKQAVAQLLV